MSKEIRALIRQITQDSRDDEPLSTNSIIQKLTSNHDVEVQKYNQRILRMGLERLINEVARQANSDESALTLFPDLQRLPRLITVVERSADGKLISVRKRPQQLTAGDVRRKATAVTAKRAANAARNPYQSLVEALDKVGASDAVLVIQALS